MGDWLQLWSRPIALAYKHAANVPIPSPPTIDWHPATLALFVHLELGITGDRRGVDHHVAVPSLWPSSPRPSTDGHNHLASWSNLSSGQLPLPPSLD